MLPATGFDDLIVEVDQTADHLYESREERKFVMPVSVAQLIRHALAERMTLEEFVPGRKRTLVHSIYFDDDVFSLYQASLALESSLKFRLRGYAGCRGEVDALSFFECKLGMRDENSRKKKRKLRFQVPHLFATLLFDRLAEKRATPELLNLAPKPKFWRKALKFVSKRQLVPTVTVCYEREAFVSADATLRVTIDEHFRASRIQPDNSTLLGEVPAQLPGMAIIEVKFIGAFPEWLAEVLAGVELSPEGQAFSKFKTAVPMVIPEARTIA